MLFHLALCHTIITERVDGQVQYNASSPDELALINFAKFCGVQYLGTNEQRVAEVRFRDRTYLFEVLHTLEFNSTRKRMSVVVRDRQTQQVRLLTKGADSVILARKRYVHGGCTYIYR